MSIVNYDIGQIFSGRSSNTLVQGFDAPVSNVPTIDPGYVFSGWHADVLAWVAHLADRPLYLYGPLGCGKSSVVKQIAARLNWPVFEITGHEALQSVDLEGHMALDSQSTVWRDGPLAKAMRHGGVFLFNEIDAAMPSATIALNTILDGAPLCLEQTGDVIQPHPLFRFVATGNTSGNGDETGAYTGIARQNVAFLDRFFTIRADYLPPDVERSLVKQAAPSLPASVIDQMMKFVRVVRMSCVDDAPENFKDFRDLTTPVSTRALCLWARAAVMYQPLAERGVNVLQKAMRHAIGAKRAHAEGVALSEILQRITGE